MTLIVVGVSIQDQQHAGQLRALCAAVPHGTYIDTADSAVAMKSAFAEVAKLINAQELMMEDY